MVAPASNTISKGVQRFETERRNGRRFHAQSIGPDMDPDYCFADFVATVARAKGKNQKLAVEGKRRLEQHYKTAMTESSGPLGGYLVPVELGYGLMQTVDENAIIRPRAYVQPMESSTFELPLPDATTAQSAGTAPYFGGVLMSFAASGGTLTETEPTFRNVVLKAWRMGGTVYLSNTFLEDGGMLGLEAYLKMIFGRAMAYYEDYYFLRGSGLGQPMGMLNAPAAVAVTRAAANRFKLVDAATMIDNLLPGSYGRAIWLISANVTGAVSAISEVFQLVSAATQSGWQSNYPDVEDSRPIVGCLLGRVAYVTDKLPVLGVKGDVMLVDPGLYVIGDRKEFAIDASQVPKFTSNQMTWRVSERYDGQPWLSQSVTLQDGATTASSIVILN